MLAIIEHKQQPPLPQALQQRLVDRVVPSLLHPQRAGDRVRQPIRPIQFGQLDDPHTIRELPPKLTGRGQRKPALANPARADQRNRMRDSSSRLTSESSRPRPTKLLSSTGRLPGANRVSSRAIARSTFDDPRPRAAQPTRAYLGRNESEHLRGHRRGSPRSQRCIHAAPSKPIVRLHTQGGGARSREVRLGPRPQNHPPGSAT